MAPLVTGVLTTWRLEAAVAAIRETASALIAVVKVIEQSCFNAKDTAEDWFDILALMAADSDPGLGTIRAGCKQPTRKMSGVDANQGVKINSHVTLPLFSAPKYVRSAWSCIESSLDGLLLIL